MTFDIHAVLSEIVNEAPDMTVATKGGGGGGFEKPVEGFTRLRLVGYVETGKHESKFKDEVKVTDRVELIFELSGPKHPPLEIDGKKAPHRVTVRVNKSLHEKSNFFALFKAMNWEGTSRHMAQLVGKEFVGTVTHRTAEIAGTERVFVNLTDIRKPFVTDPETGDSHRLAVDPPRSDLRLFIWDYATPEMWDSLYIEGEYPARKDDKGKETAPARSKNALQEKIRAALNLESSPIKDLILGNVSKKDTENLSAVAGKAEKKPEAPKKAPIDDELGF